MTKKRYTEEQIISNLKEHEAGAFMPALSRRHGVAENAINRWKSKFGGMEVSEAKRLRNLEQENARLKRLLADGEAYGGAGQVGAQGAGRRKTVRRNCLYARQLANWRKALAENGERTLEPKTGRRKPADPRARELERRATRPGSSSG